MQLRQRGDELDQILDDTPVQVLDDRPLTLADRHTLFSAAVAAFETRRTESSPVDVVASVDLSAATFASPLLVTIGAYPDTGSRPWRLTNG